MGIKGKVDKMVVLACEDCKERNYTTTKNKKTLKQSSIRIRKKTAQFILLNWAFLFLFYPFFLVPQIAEVFGEKVEEFLFTLFHVLSNLKRIY